MMMLMRGKGSEVDGMTGFWLKAGVNSNSNLQRPRLKVER
jgi:hypothetical protein